MWSVDERFAAFFIAHEALDSKVERINQSVYGLSKETIGEFDFAFIGTLLLHLRKPVDALAAIRRVLKPDGLLMTNDAISLPLTVFRPKTAAAEVVMEAMQPFWYVPNAAGRKTHG